MEIDNRTYALHNLHTKTVDRGRLLSRVSTGKITCGETNRNTVTLYLTGVLMTSVILAYLCMKLSEVTFEDD